MKKLVILLGALTAINTFACETYEAQIAAEVASVEQVSAEECVVSLEKFSHYSTHALCPLYKETVINQGVTMFGNDCKREVGSAFSGILVDDGSTIYLD